MGKKSFWRRRYNLVIVLFFVGLILYFDRAVISTALPFIAKDLNLSPVSMGIVLSAFSISYAIIQIPGGLLADKLGSRIVGTLAIAWWSVFTFLTGCVGSLAALVAVRFAFGFGEGSFVPAQYKALAVWFPKKERGRATSLVNTAITVGGAVTSIIAAILIKAFGWRFVFYSFLIPGIILTLVYFFIVKDSPEKNKRISKEELAEINEDDDALETAEKVRIADVLKFPVVWQLFFTLLFSGIAATGLLGWLATYVIKGLKGTVMQVGVAALVASIGALIGTVIGGIIADKLRTTQKYQMFFGWIVSAIFLFIAVFSNTLSTFTINLTIMMFFFYIAQSAFVARMSTALPRNAMGLGVGVIQCSQFIAGALSPVLVGFLVQLAGGSFKAAFMTLSVCIGISGFLALTIRKTNNVEKKGIAA